MVFSWLFIAIDWTAMHATLLYRGSRILVVIKWGVNLTSSNLHGSILIRNHNCFYLDQSDFWNISGSHSFNLSVQCPFIQTRITRNVKKSSFLISGNACVLSFHQTAIEMPRLSLPWEKSAHKVRCLIPLPTLYVAVRAHREKRPRKLTCKHSRPYRSASGKGSWVYLPPHRSSWARWSVAVSLNRPCRCKGRTAARGCTPEARGQRTAARPCCTSIGYTNPTWWRAWCMLTHTRCAVSGTHHRRCKLWPRPGSGSPLSCRAQNLWRIKMFLRSNL